MKIRAAGKFFSYVAAHFPVMCASGAFPAFPPTPEAAKRLDRLDDLTQKGIRKHIGKLEKFKLDFKSAEKKAESFDDRALCQGLTICADLALAELRDVRTWEKDPKLYLQLAFTGLNQSLIMPAKSEKVREKRFIKRLKALPKFLAVASANVEAITPTSRGTAQTMVRDCARYLTELGESDIGRSGKVPALLTASLAALRDFDRFVTTRPEIPESDGPSFNDQLALVGADKSPQQIFEIAKKEFQQRTQSLRELQEAIDPASNWKTLHAEYTGPAEENAEAMDVIVREIHRLRNFVFEKALPGLPDSPLIIDTQPAHLASTLRPIHYDPALGSTPEEPSRCYVSPLTFSGRGFRDDPTRLARIKREFPFMAARQTYPGRHLLDAQRRAMGESLLAQVTNPYFMAGWLAFVEDLLDELGYLKQPMDRLVHHHRGLCRAALAMIDAGLAAGDMDQDTCLSILADAGFSHEESLKRVRSIRLHPAQRVLPVLGLHEVRNLRTRSGMELGPFCKELLAHGQLPFSLLEERLVQD